MDAKAMAYLDLSQLPTSLRALLERKLDNDESRRRALLAPDASCFWAVTWPHGLYPWRPASRLLYLPGTLHDLRIQYEGFLGSRLFQPDPDSPSIFHPDLPFFPTPLTEVKTALRSPFPEAFTDAEFWAYTMQACYGDAQRAESKLRGWAKDLGKRRHGMLGWARFHWYKRGLMPEIWYRHQMSEEGAYS